MNKLSNSPFPANIRESNPFQEVIKSLNLKQANKPIRLTNIELNALKEEMLDLNVPISRKQQIVNEVGWKALQSGNEASEIFHIHRWSRVKTVDNETILCLYRCRRCELMKAIELFVEKDNSGRAVVKRLDRYVESVDSQQQANQEIEHNKYYQK